MAAFAELSGIVFVCVAETWFHGKIVGGALPLGPNGVIAIKTEHAPAWLRAHFDQGELTADSSEDEEVKELLALVEAGHAAIIPSARTFYMHVDSKVTPAFGFGDSSPAASEGESVAAAEEHPGASEIVSTPESGTAPSVKRARVW
jgi:hypothetical protein